MKKNVILILVSNRSKSAVTVQKLLTDFGCIIKTRLGIHDGVENVCSECGLVMVELSGDDKEAKHLHEKLSAVKGVTAKLVSLKMN
ncbi:MAG: hypothetical protein PHW02_00630 [bacterium]|nr:hypothetical protein [bacterium]